MRRRPDLVAVVLGTGLMLGGTYLVLTLAIRAAM